MTLVHTNYGCWKTRLKLLAAWLALASAALARADDAVVDYARDIRPLLAERCFTCYGDTEQESGLRLDQRQSLLRGGESGQPALVPGKSSASEIMRRITSTEADAVMPPEGQRLSPAEISLVRRWIDAGAAMPQAARPDVKLDHWAWQPVRVVPPAQRDDPFIAGPIDAYILAELAKHDLRPSPPADGRTLVRRVYFDMLGLPPTPEEVAEFASDRDPQAYARLVERVLNSPHYGERWAQHWLDVVRYGDTHGFEVNTPRPNSWPYRDWVIRSLNEDLPYDRFVFEQLAGDTVGVDAATGFLVAGPALLPGQIGKDRASKLQARQDELNEIINATGSAFLGLTISCARCHNHKFDPIAQTDYYALQAVFAGVGYGDRPLRGALLEGAERQRDKLVAELAGIESQLDALEPIVPTGDSDPVRPAVNPLRNVERFAPVAARFVRFTCDETNNGIEPCLDELEVFSAGQQRQNVASSKVKAQAISSSNYPPSEKHKLEHINDGRYGNEFSWISGEPGHGWVQIELQKPEVIDRIVWGRDRNGVYGDRLPVVYRIEVAERPGAWQQVASSATRQAYAPASAKPKPEVGRQDQLVRQYQELRRKFARTDPRPMVFAGVFRSPEPVHRLYRGDPQQPREVTPPEALAAFKPLAGALGVSPEATDAERRAALARWITGPGNPLAARVLVNRLWQHHFGTGLVDTPSDFGRNGSRPTHPELLDYLADSLVRSGWSMKALHRQILLSSTYRQADTPRAEALAKDAGARLLWRYPPRRLEAEVIRDSVLRVAGSLDTRMGGPGFLVFKANENYVRVYDAKEEWGPADWRRMVYMHKVRMAQDGVFGAFDCPDAGLPAPKRSVSTTAVQSLNLLNSTFMVQQAQLLGKRIAKEAGNDPSAQVRRAFQLVLQREPTGDQLAQCQQLATEHGLPALCRVLFNTNEFLFMP